MHRRDFLGALGSTAAAQPARRPNIVFLLVDDLRFDELACTGHPFAQTPAADRLAREGATFANAFATTPLCSPSRAAFLTGLYSHTNGIVDNVARNALSHQLITWPRLLHDSGYRTAFLGKWHMGNDDSPRPGFDRWVSFRGQGECNDPELNIDGRRTPSRGYVTDILAQHAVEFIEGSNAATPFCLYLAHKAIHPNVVQNDDGSVSPSTIDDDDQFIPAERHRTLYEGRTPPRRANYHQPPRRKPALEHPPEGVAPLSPATGTSDRGILNRMRMMKAVDESTAAIVAALERKGVLDDTIIVFTSDHGYFYGEHGLGPERRLAYEETIHIPLLVRYPRRFRPGSRPKQMVLSTDVAATALSLAGVKPPQPLHGRPLWSTARRDAVLIEYFSDRVFARIRNMGYHAVRTERWKLIHYRHLQDADELYDLRRDPYELNNLIADRGTPLPQLRARLAALLTESGATPR